MSESLEALLHHRQVHLRRGVAEIEPHTHTRTQTDRQTDRQTHTHTYTDR